MTAIERLKFGLGVTALGLTISAGLLAQNVSPEVQLLYQQAQEAQAANHAEAAIAAYRKIVKLAPELAPAYNNLGRLLYNLDRYPEAIAILKQGLLIAPEMHPAQVMLGASYFKLDRFDQALAPLEAGVKAMPGDVFARVMLAQTLISLDRPQQAVSQLDAVLLDHPADQQAWYLLGKLHLQLSQQAFAKVQAIDPSAPLAHVMAGEIMESMQNTPGAVDAYKQAIAAAPGDPDPLEHLAELYWHTGDWAHARDAYKALLLKQLRNCSAHWKLANSLDELGEPPTLGLQEVNTALTQCPSLVQAHAERARILLRLGKAAEALPDLETAQRGATDDPSVQRLFAQAYRALGDRVRADAANQRFLQLEKEQRDAQERHAARVLQANQ